jgi:O-antigen/teichoic acid export membrane protein
VNAGTMATSQRTFVQTAISRASWNIADQAVSSLTNAALSILVARSVDAHSFGTFAICFSTYTLIIGATRTLASDPLTVRFSDASPESFAAERRSALAGATALGVAASAVLFVAAATQGNELRNALLALALTMPGLALQDALRLSFITEGRPRAAAVNDFLWGVLLAGGVFLLLFADVSSVAVFVLVWGAAAVVAGVLGVFGAKALPAPRGALRWLREQLHLSGFFVSEYMAVFGSIQIAMLLVGAIGEVSDVGSLRGGFVLLGPLTVMFFGIAFFATPEIVRRKALPQRHHLTWAVGVSGAFLSATLVWGGIVLQLPDAAGRELLGDAWAGARDVLPGLIGVQIAVAAALGPACVLRAFGAVRETIRLNLLLAPLLLLFAVIGVQLDGAEGAAIGFMIAQLVPVPLFWSRLLRVTAANTPYRSAAEPQRA